MQTAAETGHSEMVGLKSSRLFDQTRESQIARYSRDNEVHPIGPRGNPLNFESAHMVSRGHGQVVHPTKISRPKAHTQGTVSHILESDGATASKII
jgi:hypothetical protein